MLNSSEKLNFIQKYMTEYETKLKLNNSLGLYDEAKLFEIFAQCICKIWFNMPFSNLNEKDSNYPYVDLISEDGSIYVQVTTNMDVPNKIKTTLEKRPELLDKVDLTEDDKKYLESLKYKN